MVYLGLTASTKPKNSEEQESNPFENINDNSSDANNFDSHEAAMADIYARDFMKRMGYSLTEKIPILAFKEHLLRE